MKLIPEKGLMAEEILLTDLLQRQIYTNIQNILEDISHTTKKMYTSCQLLLKEDLNPIKIFLKEKINVLSLAEQ